MQTPIVCPTTAEWLACRTTRSFAAASTTARAWCGNSTSASDWGDDWSRVWTDANGDGVADYCRLSAKADESICSIASGAGIFAEHRWTHPRADQPEGRRWADVNGDNIADYCWSASTGQLEQVHCEITAWSTADVLGTIANGLGSLTEIKYGHATSAPDTRLPLGFPIVRSVVIHDGRGRSSATDYAFEGGRWNRAAREFRGFAKATVTGPPDAFGNRQRSETWFHQGDGTAPLPDDPDAVPGYMKGRPFKIVVSDSTRATTTATTTTYAHNLLSAPRFFNPVTVVTTESCAGGSCRSTRNRYEYDDFGNLRREVQEGDVSSPADDRYTVRTFAIDAAAWIVGLMKTEEIFSGLASGVKQFGLTNDYAQELDCTARQLVPSRVPGRVGRIISWRGTQAPSETWVGYGDAGEVRCTRDARGHVSATEYDRNLVRPVRLISPTGLTTTTSYYGVDGVPEQGGLFGLPKITTDANDRESLTEYDQFGRVTRVKTPDGGQTELRYENLGDVTRQSVSAVTDWGLTRREFIDGLGRVYRTVLEHREEAPIQQLIEFDDRGNRTAVSYWHAVSDRRPRSVRTSFDFLDRAVETRSPDGSVTKTCFGAWEAVTVERDGRLRREQFDAAGRLSISEEHVGSYRDCDAPDQPPARVTRYTYDVMGRLSRIDAVNGRTIAISYDPMGRILQRTDSNTGSWTYAYDEAGNLERQTDPRGAVAEYEYDAENRPKQVSYTFNGATRHAAFEYDGDKAVNRRGRLKSASWDDNRTAFEYDNLGRVSRITRSDSTTSADTLYAYDTAGRLQTLQFPDGAQQLFAYRGRNLGSVDTPAGNVVRILERDDTNRIRRLRYGNGVESSFEYCPDQEFRPCSLKTLSPTGETLQASHATFDGAGRPVQKLDPVWGDEFFRYDSAGRLLFAQGPYGRQGWAYDNAGNVTVSSRVGSIVYGDPAARDRITAVEGKPYTYDAAGNQTSGSNRRITYDERGQPTRLEGRGIRLTRSYDADGDLRWQQAAPRGVWAWTKELVTFGKAYPETTWSGDDYRCEGRDCHRVLRVGPRVLGYQRVSDGQTSFVHDGLLGREELVTSQNGSVQRRSWFSPFGELHAKKGSARGVPFVFGGGELDQRLGLVTLGRRLYDPRLGRFIQPDPVAQTASTKDALNPYAYAFNDPVSYVDPEGEFPAILIGIIVGAVLGGAAAALQGGDLSDILRAAVIGAIAGGVGAAVGLGASALVNGGAAGAVLGSAAGGAAGNATAAFLYGGDVGRAARTGFIAGFFGGGFGYATSYAVGGMIGGGVAAHASGGDFWQGAFQGLVGAIVAGNIASELMWEGRVDASTKFSDGDVIAFEAEKGDTLNRLWSRLIGEPQSHVGLKTKEGIFDTVPGGARKSSEDTFLGRRYVKASVGAEYDMNLVRELWRGAPDYGVGSGKYVCSTLVNAVTNGATLGLSPGQVVASVNGYRPGMDRVWDVRKLKDLRN